MRRKYIRTIIDVEIAPPVDAPDRTLWEGKRPLKLPPEVQDWFAEHLSIERIAYVVRVLDSPIWLWKECQFDGKEPSPVGSYVIWHTEPDDRREILYGASLAAPKPEATVDQDEPLAGVA